MSNESQKKGKFEHKVFKAVILFLVSIFIVLIFYFIYVQLNDSFSPSSESKTSKASNKYSQYFFEMDKTYNYKNNITAIKNNNIETCNSSNLYSDFISQNKPCKYNIKSDIYFNNFEKAFDNTEFQKIVNITIVDLKLRNDKSEVSYRHEDGLVAINQALNSINITNSFDILNQKKDLIQIKINSKNYTSSAKLEQNDKLFYQIKGTHKFSLVPSSQLKQLSPYRQYLKNQNLKNTTNFETEVFTDTDLINFDRDKVVSFYTELQPNEMLYIPAYYFVQYISESDFGVSLNFQFNSNSRLLDNMMSILIEDIKIKST